MVSDILPDIMYDISQAGLLPPLDKEAAGIITGSEAIFKEFASKHSLNASTINSFIKDVLKNPAFNADDVDTDMLHTFGSIQWECELFHGRPKARCYPFDINGHRFRNKNPKVCRISDPIS
jgi:hypothetical protein